MHHVIADRPLLFIAHDGVDVVHFGEVVGGQNISTGQPELETYEAHERDAWLARLLALGVAPESLPVEDDKDSEVEGDD
jgi:hypothetical protein